MIVKDLIKRLKKMPQTKEVYFFNHHNERLYSLDDGVWNIPNEKGKETIWRTTSDVDHSFLCDGWNIEDFEEDK